MAGPLKESQSSRADPPAGAPAAAVAGTNEPGTDSPEVEASAAARVIYFSDAVVAIAMTLLALALPLPQSTDGTSNARLLHALAHNWPGYLAFLISFLVVGNLWAAHRRIFRYVNRTNRRVAQLTVLWLLMVVLVPFAARLLAGSGGFGVRFTVYVLIQVTASACLVLMNREVIRADLLRPEALEAGRQPDNVLSCTVIAAFLLSVPVAFFSAWAFAFWAAVPLVARAIRWRRAHGPHAVAVTVKMVSARLTGRKSSLRAR